MISSMASRGIMPVVEWTTSITFKPHWEDHTFLIDDGKQVGDLMRR
jgi:hypothetical protein